MPPDLIRGWIPVRVKKTRPKKALAHQQRIDRDCPLRQDLAVEQIKLARRRSCRGFGLFVLSNHSEFGFYSEKTRYCGYFRKNSDEVPVKSTVLKQEPKKQSGEDMSRASAEIVTFRMTVSDASDGAIRILTDAQRFGLDLVSLNLQAQRPAGEADLMITLASARPIDSDLLAIRFVRHPSVLRVQAETVTAPLDVEADVVIAA